MKWLSKCRKLPRAKKFNRIHAMIILSKLCFDTYLAKSDIIFQKISS